MAYDSNLRTARSLPTDTHTNASERSPSAAGSDPLVELARLIGQDDLFEKMRRDAARAGHDPAPYEDERSPARRAEPDWPAEKAAMPGPELRGAYDPHEQAAPMGRGRETLDAGTRRLADTGFGGLEELSSASSAYAPPARRSYATPRPIEESHDNGGYADARSLGRDPAYAEPAYAPSAVAGSPYPDSHGEAYAADPAAPRAYEQGHAEYDPAYAYDDPEYAHEPVRPERRRGGLMTMMAVGGLAIAGTAGAFGYWTFSGERRSGEPPVITANPSPGKVAPATQNRGNAAERDRASGQGGERVVPREEQPVQLQQARASAPRNFGPGAQSGVAGLSGQSTAAMVPPSTAAGASTNPDAPKRVKTIAIRPDGSTMTDTARPQGAAQAPRPSATTASAPTRTASIPPTVAPAGGGHVVQVASQRSEQDAQASFRALQAKYPSVLGGRDPLIRRIDLGERGIFFRVQVGPFASIEQANDLCTSLKAAGGQCIVQRN